MKRGECMCGSGLERFALHDARGIFVSFVCDRCEATIKKCYRPEIFDDPGYWHDEPIEEDE